MYHKDRAIVLSRKTFREDDLLITIYTHKYGKIVLQAVGAKKIKSKMAGHIEPMNLVDVEWVYGKILDKLTGAVVSSSFSGIKEDVSKTAYGMYLLEIVEQATENNHADNKIFELLLNFLDKISKVDNSKLSILRIIYIYKFLALSGFSPLFKKAENSNEFNLIKKIIYLPTEEFLKEKINSKELKLIFKDSQIFLNEVLEKQLLTENFLKNYV
jgi:DNA repair protein RecO (recombination protein O)